MQNKSKKSSKIILGSVVVFVTVIAGGAIGYYGLQTTQPVRVTTIQTTPMASKPALNGADKVADDIAKSLDTVNVAQEKSLSQEDVMIDGIADSIKNELKTTGEISDEKDYQ